MYIRHKLCTTIVTLILISATSPLYALTPSDVIGEYTLTGIAIQYPGDPILTQDDASSWTGRASATTRGIVAEIAVVYQGQGFSARLEGFYTLQGDTMVVSIAGLPTQNVTVTLSGNTLTTSGSAFDDFGDQYDFTYTWNMTDTYYTQTQLDQAVADATAAIKPKVVVVPLGD